VVYITIFLHNFLQTYFVFCVYFFCHRDLQGKVQGWPSGSLNPSVITAVTVYMYIYQEALWPSGSLNPSVITAVTVYMYIYQEALCREQ
jgi:hypothetical protein